MLHNIGQVYLTWVTAFEKKKIRRGQLISTVDARNKGLSGGQKYKQPIATLGLEGKLTVHGVKN